jgi:Co/Zn/Cd efflux system component
MFLALGALFEVVRRFAMGSDPMSPLMIGIGLLALVANASCLLLLAKHRQGGAHMKASWIFSTNDVIANMGVILAGLLVAVTNSRYPDLVIGSLIAVIVFRGSLKILRL